MTDSDKAQPALLFIPDLSGFTEFVRDTEIEHSRHIIEELLEAIMAANDCGLEVSEIEGDAILFYRFGPAPAAAELFAQVEKMFLAVHGQLRRYATQRICQCGACVSAPGLTLKIVAHHGPVTLSRVREHEKLFGEDVITAHRLMKNDLDTREYALFTRALTAAWDEDAAPDWSGRVRSSQVYDVGTIEFDWVSLSTLHERVPEPESEDFSIVGETRKVFSCEVEIDAPLEFVFEVTSNLPGRLHWMAGATDVEMLNAHFNRLGTRHRCVVDKSSPVMVTSGSTRDGEVITLAETDEKRTMCSVYVMQRVDPARTRMRVDGLLKDSLPLRILFSLLLKKKLSNWFAASSENLKHYCEAAYSKRDTHALSTS